jgi:hypothetical protein
MWIKAVKWLSLIAICIGILYNIGDQQERQLVLAGRLSTEKDRRTKDVTVITTQYHKGLVKIRDEADNASTILLDGGLRDDLKHRACVPTTDRPARTSGASYSGLYERDVTDLIELARTADETKRKLTACQGVIKSWTSKAE